MRQFLFLLVVVVIGLGVVGYYRGWYEVSTTHSGDTTNVNIAVDKDKMRQDEQRLKEKVRGAVDRAKEKIEDSTSSKPK